MLEFIEWNKLNNVSFSESTIPIAEQWLLIAIQSLHVLKVSITDSYYDNWKWVLWTTNDLVNCILHIVDYSICYDKQNIEFLVIKCGWFKLCFIVNGLYDATEMGRSVKTHIWQTVFVMSNNIFDTINSWVKNISIHRKTMWGSLVIRWDRTTKAIKIDLFVWVVKL